MIPKELVIVKENESILEYRYNRKLLYVNLAFMTFFALYIISYASEILPMEFMFLVALLPLSLGVVPLLFGRRLVVDKQAKRVTLILSFGFVEIRSRMIDFSKIRHIEINESALGVSGHPRGWIHDMKDTIYLNLHGENKVKLTVSKSDLYSNEFTYKLSEAIGCKVITARL